MITMSGFTGEIPRVIPRLLPDGAAQIAVNCKLIDGAIVPLRYPADSRSMASGNVYFYKRGDVWFEYNKIVDVANAPIAQNRLYMTGDGAPKIITDASVIYPLAVKKPAAPLTAAVTGTPDILTQETVVYTYTYVTTYDEESEPADVSNEVLRSSGMDVTLTGFLAPPSDRNYNRIRIYRSQTSASGVTNLYFIYEIMLPVPTPSFIDVVEDNPIQEAITSLNYNAPPDDLSGIITLPNGMLAGFVGNKLYLSEPYIPHAWPQKYILTTDYDIVGLGAFGRSIAIMTKGYPYIATGITPDAMAMERIEVNYPCINKRGIVDLGYSVAYPSSDGLVVISSQGAQLVSRNLFTRNQWQDLSPETLISAQFDGRYIAGYSYTDSAGVAQSGTMIIDLSGEQPFLSRTSLTSTYMFFEVGAGKLYLLNGSIAQEWDAPSQQYMQMRWRSKKFVMTGGINMGASMVDADAALVASTATPSITINDATFVSQSFGGTVVYGGTFTPTAGSEFEAKVYADGSLINTFTTVNNTVRLPSGFLARTWEIEVSGRRPVTAMYFAWSPSELYVGAA